MATVLAIGSLLVLFGLPVLGLTCHLFCEQCRERYRQMQRDARQMQVARDLARLARQERMAKQPDEAAALLVMRKAR